MVGVHIDKGLLGETLLKYQEIALLLNSFPTSKQISVEELAEKAEVHWNTAKKALVFFSLSEPILPHFEIDDDFRFTILKKPHALDVVNIIYNSYEMRIITKMMLKNMVKKTNGLKMKELKNYLTSQEIYMIHSLIEKGYINSEDGVFYLSLRGKILGNDGIIKLLDLGIPIPIIEDAFKLPPKIVAYHKKSTTIQITEEDTVTFEEYTENRDVQKSEVDSPVKTIRIPL